MTLKPFQIRYLGYWLLLLMLITAGWLDLATPLLTVLFSIFVLSKLRFGRSKIIPAALFIILVLGVLYLFGYFIKQAVDALPQVVEDSIPRIQTYLHSHGWSLPGEMTQSKGLTNLSSSLPDSMDSTSPLTNSLPSLNANPNADETQIGTATQLEDFKRQSVRWLRTQLGYLGNFAKIATKEFAFLLIGLVVAISLFFNSQMDLDRERHALRNNLYSFACDEIVARFRSFYESFARVMGAQIIISILNTGFTAIYLLAVGLPYAWLVIVITFLCGLLPIIGNLISNSIIVVLSFRISPQLAIASLVFLVVLHKLEYFLNSKIIGDRIKNPVWLTLLGLLIGERLMGIPGMILAPVVLNFIKVEATTVEIPAPAARRAQREADRSEELEVP
jgi:predicted PurR-regulated permease PerM